MKLRSDFREAVTIMNRLHRESGEERPEPIPFHQHQRWHSSSSSSSTSWWQWNEHWWSSYFSICCSQDGLQLMAICCNRHGVWTEHPHTSHFLVLLRTHNKVARDIVSSVSARHPIHVSCACVSDLSSTLHFALFTVSLIFYFILLIFMFTFYVGRFWENSPVRFREWGVWLFGQQRSSHIAGSSSSQAQ